MRVFLQFFKQYGSLDHMVGDKNKISERLVWFSNTGQGRVSEVFGYSLPLMVVGVLYYVPIRMIQYIVSYIKKI